MARVEVRQLRYRGEPERAGRVEFAVADALRTEVVDDGRLVLVHNFRLGRIGLGERGASREVASAWRTIRDNARHGGVSGAESANCVWFADAAEARALLMRELASGRTPFAWFWSLAVPDWRRETFAQWLGRRLDEAARDTSGQAMAALLAEALAADCVEAVVAAISARVPPMRLGGSPAPIADEAPFTATGLVESASAERLKPVADQAGQAIALAIAGTVPTPLRAVLAAVAARSELAEVVEVLARGLVRRAHPALALAPVRLVAIAAEVVRILRFGEPLVADAPNSPRMAVGEASASGQETPRSDPLPASDRAPPAAFFRDAEAAEVIPLAPLPPVPLSLPTDLSAVELRSAAAGLFLVIVPLLRLGWREWLIERPHLLTHQPGARLLRRIAAHYHVRATDPLWHVLPPVEPANDPPHELADALLLWRAGLDGWLRRRAHIRLADLVLRQGWLLPGVETTLVRFPLETIEIRLRRLALDGDPGWVDWLGHSYRLVYRDRPLLGSEFA